MIDPFHFITMLDTTANETRKTNKTETKKTQSVIKPKAADINFRLSFGCLWSNAYP